MRITVQMDIDIQTPNLEGSEARAIEYISGLLSPMRSHHLTAIRKLMMGPKSEETEARILVHEVDQKNIEALLNTLRVQAR